MKTRSFLIAWAFLLSATLAFAQAPSKPKDDDLDDLLNKVEQREKQSEKPKSPEAKAKAKDEKPASPSDKPKTSGEVTGKDKELDELLGKLGETKDEPKAEKKSPMGGAGGDDKPMPGGGPGDENKSKPESGSTTSKAKKKDDLNGQNKQLDEHLEELTGRRRQKKGEEGGEGKPQENQGPLGDLIKEMREVEERLGKPDTGEQTRQKQTEIVKRMDTLIEQMKSARNQQQAMRMLRRGQQPGRQDQNNPDNQQQGPPATVPARPETKSALALDKNAWGHLPPDLRAEMENVFKEDLLPGRADLIKRYYLSVSKKSVARGE